MKYAQQYNDKHQMHRDKCHDKRNYFTNWFYNGFWFLLLYNIVKTQ